MWLSEWKASHQFGNAAHRHTINTTQMSWFKMLDFKSSDWLKEVQQKYTNETLLHYLFFALSGSIYIISCTESLYICIYLAWVHYVTQYVIIPFFVALVIPVLFWNCALMVACPFSVPPSVWFSIIPVFFHSFPSPVLFPPHSTCTSSPRWCVCIKSLFPPLLVTLFCVLLRYHPMLLTCVISWACSQVYQCLPVVFFWFLFLVFSLNLLLLCLFVLWTRFCFFSGFHVLFFCVILLLF